MRSFLKAACLTAAICLVPTASEAALLVYEGFDYPAGNLRGQNGGSGSIGWGGAWTQQDNTTTGSAGSVVAGSMEYSTLVTSGNRASIPQTSGNAGRDWRYFGSTISGLVHPEIWISFVIQSSSDGANHAGIGLFNNTSHTVGTEMTTIGKGSGDTWGYATGLSSAGNFSQSSTTPTTLSLLVYRFETDAVTGRATSHLWVNPSLGSTPATASADAFWAQQSGQFAFNRIRVSHAQAGATLSVDELRVGTSFADVAPVPEPASLGVLALGGMALLRRQRRE
jgi:hypothetical protein